MCPARARARAPAQSHRCRARCRAAACSRSLRGGEPRDCLPSAGSVFGGGRPLTVVLGGHLLGRPHHLEGDKLVALGLEASDDVADEAALHAVGLDRDERALVLGSRDAVGGELGGRAGGGRGHRKRGGADEGSSSHAASAAGAGEGRGAGREHTGDEGTAHQSVRRCQARPRASLASRGEAGE